MKSPSPSPPALRGCQKPTYRFIQEYEISLDEYADKIMQALGITLDEWQRPILRDWLAVDASGQYVHMRCVLVVPRQNGKTLIIEARILFGVILKREKILYTAQDYSTVTKLFDRLKEYFGDKANDPEAQYPDLNRLVKSVRKSIGKEAIFFKNGAVIYLSTRTKTAKRGYTVDVFIGDEAQELTEGQAKALLSTASSGEQGNPQYIYAGTPPDAESAGDVLPSMREKAHSKQGRDLTYTEWSTPEVGEIFDIDRWYRYNPSLGIRLSERALYGIAETFTDPTSFAQECLGYFLPTGGQIKTVVPIEDWNACIADPPSDGEVFFAVKFSPGGEEGVVAACLKPDDDNKPYYVEIVAIEALVYGTAIFERFCMDVAHGVRRIVVDGAGTAEDFRISMKNRGFPIKKLLRIQAADAICAYAGFVNAISSMRIRHMGQTPLANAVTKTAERRIGSNGAFGFATTEDGDATVVEAAALAYWIANKTPRREPEGADLWVW